MAASNDTLKKTAQFDYVLHIVCMLFSLGALVIVPLVLNYVRRGDSVGTVYESHFNHMISTFWSWVMWMIGLGVLYFILGLLTLTVGFWLFSPIFLIAYGIFLYRMIKGLLRVNDDQPI
jgi:uncharacterized membrane protein